MLKKISLISVLAIGVLSVLLALPITDSFIEHSKYYVVVFGALVVVTLFIVKTFKERALTITMSPVTSALIFFALATAASTFFTADYPVEGLLGLGGIFLSTSLIALLGGSIMPKNITEKFLYFLTGSSVALVVLSLMQMVGFGPAQIMNKAMGISLPTSLAFNLSGSSFIALQIVGLTLFTVLVHIVTTKKLSKFFAVTVPILVIGTGVFAWSLLPGKETSLLLPSFSASWSVMLDTIKAPKSALIGAGVSSYRNAYQVFKPIWMNGTNEWSIAFTQGANMPLTIITSMGILGFLAWAIFVIKSMQFHKNSLVGSKAIGSFVIASLLLNIVLPFNTVLLTLQAIAIACLVANEKHRLPLLQMQALKFKVLNKPVTVNPENKGINFPLYLGTLLGLLVILVAGYFTTRSLQANMVMAQSSAAVAQDNIVAAYEFQQKAVQLNPYYDVFRRRYSATSALIAIALSNKADITENEKQQVSALLQQSVTEARAAVALDNSESQNWSNLAQIYANLIGVSEDAVDWTIQSYVSAIEMNPNDPIMRLELASIFVSQEAYQQALSLYDQAINLKADLAISHFKRGELLEMIETPESLREARLAYQRTLVLLPADSEDYVVVNNKLEELEKFMEENNIPLVAEAQETPQQQTEQTPEEQLLTPSIIEQNLNNTNTLNPDAQPVEINEVPVEEPLVEQTETTEETQ